MKMSYPSGAKKIKMVSQLTYGDSIGIEAMEVDEPWNEVEAMEVDPFEEVVPMDVEDTASPAPPPAQITWLSHPKIPFQIPVSIIKRSGVWARLG